MPVVAHLQLPHSVSSQPQPGPVMAAQRAGLSLSPPLLSRSGLKETPRGCCLSQGWAGAPILGLFLLYFIDVFYLGHFVGI